MHPRGQQARPTPSQVRPFDAEPRETDSDHVYILYEQLQEDNVEGRLFHHTGQDIELIVCRATASIRRRLQDQTQVVSSVVLPRTGIRLTQTSAMANQTSSMANQTSSMGNKRSDQMSIIGNSVIYDASRKRRPSIERDEGEEQDYIDENNENTKVQGVDPTRQDPVSIQSGGGQTPERGSAAPAKRRKEGAQNPEELDDRAQEGDKEQAILDEFFEGRFAGKKMDKEVTRHIQREMLEKAMKIGGLEAVRMWQDLTTRWRESGTLLKKSMHSTLQRPPDPEKHSQDVCRFYSAYRQFKATQTWLHFDLIMSRFYLNELHQAYQIAIQTVEGELQDRLEHQQTLRRQGHTIATEARMRLFKILYADDEAMCDPEEGITHTKAWGDFSRTLEKASRWWTIQDKLGGPGIFGLMPPEVISNHWVEKRLMTSEVVIWCDLVLAQNPQGVEASMKWHSEVSRGCRGEPPSGKIWRLETESATSVNHHADVTKLFDQCEEGPADGNTGSMLSQPTPPRSGSPPLPPGWEATKVIESSGTDDTSDAISGWSRVQDLNRHEADDDSLAAMF